VVNEAVLAAFEEQWKNPQGQLCLIPGKDALSAINQTLQQKFAVSVTPTAIIDAMLPEEVPHDLRELIEALAKFGNMKTE
jgi:hypothetical protein